MENKIDNANRILRLMDRYPNMTAKELLYLIECRIEGEKFVISSYRCKQVSFCQNNDGGSSRQIVVCSKGDQCMNEGPGSETTVCYSTEFCHNSGTDSRVISDNTLGCFGSASHKTTICVGDHKIVR